MVILGASGSGKSTLLKLIIGLLRPTSGKVLVNGKDMGQLSEEALNEERRSMGMVFQYSALFDSLNVKENVAFGLRMHTRLSEEKIDAIVKEKLHLVGLDGIEDLMPANLSGGMKKRVSLPERSRSSRRSFSMMNRQRGSIRSVRPISVF